MLERTLVLSKSNEIQWLSHHGDYISLKGKCQDCPLANDFVRQWLSENQLVLTQVRRHSSGGVTPRGTSLIFLTAFSFPSYPFLVFRTQAPLNPGHPAPLASGLTTQAQCLPPCAADGMHVILLHGHFSSLTCNSGLPRVTLMETVPAMFAVNFCCPDWFQDK